MNAPGRQMQRRQYDDDVTDADLARGASQLAPGTAIQRSGSPYQSAVRVQVVRDLGTIENPGGKVLTRSLVEARLLAEDFFFAWDVKDRNSEDGKKRIYGISIDGAMMLQRNWGNSVVDVEVISVEKEAYIFKSTFVDLESGATCSRLYRKHRSPPPGKMEAQRWDDMAFSDGQSRAIRNVICAALPEWLQNRCLEQAVAAAEKGITPENERKSLVSRASKLGIKREQLEAKLGKTVADMQAADLVSLRAMLRTIEEGHAKAEEMFALPTPAAPSVPTMEPKKNGDSLVVQFASRIRSCWNETDLEEVVKVIKTQAEKNRLTEAEMSELRDLYRAQRGTFDLPRHSEEPVDGEFDDQDDARE